jgi:DNA-binding NarL/FixJ family response regulator
VTELLETAEERQTEPLRVLLVDDHDLFRTGLRNLLEEQDLAIVGEAATGAEAVAHVRELTPDVVVMDLNMPAMGGVEATRHIAEVSPLTRVVMLTISDEDSDVTDAILAGACGYLLKDATIQELVAGIRAAARGEALISPHIAAKVLQRIRATSAQPEIEELIRAELSDREIEVLKLIANGKDNAVIAAELHISPKTVKNHISNILMKLQIDNRIQAAVYAVRSARRRAWRLPRSERSRASSPSVISRRSERRASSLVSGSSDASRATSPSRRSIRHRSASSARASA